MADLRILSLGAGVQSSTLALMIEKGRDTTSNLWNLR